MNTTMYCSRQGVRAAVHKQAAAVTSQGSVLSGTVTHGVHRAGAKAMRSAAGR